jgi:hypothetical protein
MRTTEPEPHYNNRLASVLSIPKFATWLRQMRRASETRRQAGNQSAPCPSMSLVSTPTGSNQGRSKLRLFWRRLVGAVAIYALAMQPLLLTVAGSQLAQASALDEVTFSELCQHSSDGNPATPADQKHPAQQHCLQCFSGAFVLLGAPQSVAVATVDREFRELGPPGRALRLSSASRYSVACPRGPPFSA